MPAGYRLVFTFHTTRRLRKKFKIFLTTVELQKSLETCCTLVQQETFLSSFGICKNQLSVTQSLRLPIY